MNRRNFLKVLLGSVAAVALPSVTSASSKPIVSTTPPQDSELRLENVAVTPKTIPAEYDVVTNYYFEDYRGFRYFYTPECFARFSKMILARKGQLIGVGSKRQYLAYRIVRICDGKVFKDRYSIPSLTQKEIDKLYGTSGTNWRV